MRNKRYGIKIKLVCLTALLTVLTAVTVEADSRLRVVINNYAHSKAKIISNTVINETVHTYLLKSGIKYTDLLKINNGENGIVTSVEFDTVKLTEIKSGIISLIQNNINERENVDVNVPWGTLTGSQFLNNRGPTLKITLNLSSAVYSKIGSRFISAGINQTLHQITLSISSDVYFVMPWYRSSGSYQTEFILAETVIVGAVPDAYTNVIEYPGSSVAGEIFDYGADVG